jgi:hypothetical protein
MHPLVAHTDKAECEFCPYVGVVTTNSKNELVCPDCKAKELLSESQAPAQVKTSVQMAREIDANVRVRTDVFNAATVSIVELKKTIDDDASIENKPYALASALMGRFEHFKKVIFDANETIVSANNNQRAIQVYLNQLSNTLRKEEREKLKIEDINYKPTVVKPATVKTPKVAAPKKPKFDKAELKKWAAATGMPEFIIQSTAVARNITIEAAAKMVKAKFDATT